MYYNSTTQNKHKKTTARFNGLLRHSVWKRRWPILALALHKSVTYTYLYTYSLAHSPGPTWAAQYEKMPTATTLCRFQCGVAGLYMLYRVLLLCLVVCRVLCVDATLTAGFLVFICP